MESSTPQPGGTPDDGIIRELPRIARYARKNENDDLRFRTYLKGHLPLSDRELDRVVQEITEEVWSQIDCTTCANCCKTLQIVVDNTDIARKPFANAMSAWMRRATSTLPRRPVRFWAKIIAAPCMKTARKRAATFPICMRRTFGRGPIA
jgi:hypothetical protein